MKIAACMFATVMFLSLQKGNTEETCPCEGQNATLFEGCLCYLKWINVLISDSPRDGKAIALGVFCPEVPGVFPTELREFCSSYETGENLNISMALRAIDSYLRICSNNPDGINEQLPAGSPYRNHFL